MEAPDFIEDLIDRNCAGGIGPNRHRDRYDFFAQPALDRSVPLLQGAEASAYHLAARGVLAGSDETVDVPRLFAGKAECSSMGSGHRELLHVE